MKTDLPPVTRLEGESLSLTTSRLYAVKPGFARECTVYSPVEALFTMNAALKHAFKYDGTTYTDVRDALGNDGTTATFNSFADTHLFYLITDQPINRFYVDVTNANGTASVLTVKYYNGAYTDATATDGTDSGGATLAVDGEVTWTLPTDETTATLTIGDTDFTGFIYQLSVSATLDSTVSIAEIGLGYRNTNGGYLEPGTVTFNLEKIGGFTIWLASGLATANVTWVGYAG